MARPPRRVDGGGARRRFRVDAVLEAGREIDPGTAVHHHLRVLRVAAGDIVYLFDGHGAEARAEVLAIDEAGARLKVGEPVTREVESDLDSCLVQAVPVRTPRMETIVRQVTELGVNRIVPVLADRSPPARARPAAWQRKAERWRRIAAAAAEQCGRTWVPSIDDPCRFAELDWDGLPRPLFIAQPAADRDAGYEGGHATGQRSEREPSTAVTVMVGPEGGWTDTEIEAVRARGGTSLRLGPRVLRADTAGVVAITLLQYLWGDLGRFDARD